MIGVGSYCIAEDETLLDMNFMEKRKGVPLPLHVGCLKKLNYFRNPQKPFLIWVLLTIH